MTDHAEKIKHRHGRIAAMLAAGAISLLAATAGAEAPDAAHGADGTGSEAADASHCQPLHGEFSVQALPDDQCEAPAGRCTVGRFTGALTGDYHLILESLAPSPVANIFFYSGSSRIQLLRGGTLTGTDSGTIDFDPGRFGHFASMFTFAGAAGAAQGVTGQVIMRGRLDFLGGGSGEYTGSLCTAR